MFIELHWNERIQTIIVTFFLFLCALVKNKQKFKAEIAQINAGIGGVSVIVVEKIPSFSIDDGKLLIFRIIFCSPIAVVSKVDYFFPKHISISNNFRVYIYIVLSKIASISKHGINLTGHLRQNTWWTHFKFASICLWLRFFFFFIHLLKEELSQQFSLNVTWVGKHLAFYSGMKSFSKNIHTNTRTLTKRQPLLHSPSHLGSGCSYG